ncbi:MAG: hypothetical protein Athens101426_78 [Parcubacteria group bacterium Athens1014_26]|nr:MAG: hypothetical protein Athens101426_78 [Parcubacteria group bacterium Athens1014_26]
MNEENLGFKIVKFLETRNWNTLKIDSGVPIILRLKCPGDDSFLKTICTLIGDKGKQKLRIGICPSCGYLAHMDCPDPKWLSNFYSTSWNKLKDAGRAVQVLRKSFASGDFARKDEPIINLVKKILIDKSRYICEIGCGQGFLLKRLERLGFVNSVGVENFQSELKKMAPFSLIYCRHVLEHVYNPAEFVKLVSGLQSQGDYFMISVPNLEGAISMACLLYLPHLQYFSKNALQKILENNGYKIIDDSLTNNNEINLVVQRVALRQEKLSENYKVDYFSKIMEKFVKGLGFTKKHYSSVRRLWWHRRMDKGGQASFFRNELVDKIYWRIFSKIIMHKDKTKYPLKSALISNLVSPSIYQRDSSIEIWFENDVEFLYK